MTSEVTRPPPEPVQDGGRAQASHLKVSSISVTLVSFSTTRKLGFRFLLSSPTPPSRKPVHVSSSPITAISFPRPAITSFRCVTERRNRSFAS
ncbi:hypothetical protein EYF80_060789 [Liparis tanakae]|uniref:Uncharacterized protein n=1 Tax=Liparis tanakae TaxID=230148 RepID=A0A4Z2EKS3_9TELE|nr:hypothetical protein EYF80_060789 [Liparis tanakae]